MSDLTAMEYIITENAALTARVKALEDALKAARHRIWWIKTNVADDCKCLQSCDGCQIEIHEAVFTCRELLPSLDSVLNSTPALDLAKHDEAVRRDALEQAWRPIETAPSDGTTVDTYTNWARLRETDVHWDGKRWVRWEDDGEGTTWSECFPTHWMPLPIPPSTDTPTQEPK